MRYTVKILVFLVICIQVWGLRLNHDQDLQYLHKSSLSKRQALRVKNPEQVHFEEAVQVFQYIIDPSDSKVTLELQYKQNVKDIVESNQDPTHTFKEGINQFAFLSKEQFNAKFLTLHAPNDTQPTVDNSVPSSNHLQDVVTKTVNWTARMTPVKDQGNCGSCWAFATTAEIQGQYKIKYKKNMDVSEQQVVDCNTFDYGCDGGWYASYNYLIPVGLMLEKDYIYKATKNTCQYDQKKVKVRITSLLTSAWGSCQGIQQAVQRGPVSVAVNADWPSYVSGVVNTCKQGEGVNHAMVVVGWNKKTGVWLLRNSWGTWWGENGGYIRISGGNCNRICQYGGYSSTIK